MGPDIAFAMFRISVPWRTGMPPNRQAPRLIDANSRAFKPPHTPNFHFVSGMLSQGRNR